MEPTNHAYSSEEITVTFEPHLCIHSEKCAKELSEVFRTSVIPWINLEGADSTRIIAQIRRCPSKALKFHVNKRKAG